MLYDIDYIVAGLIFLIIVYIYLCFQYNKEMSTIKQLKALVLCLIIADAGDILTAITISYSNSVPVWINYVLNVMFFEFNVICMYEFPKYIKTILGEEMHTGNPIEYINDAILGLYAIICASSPLTHTIFYFDKNKAYQHGFLYASIFIVPLYFLLYSLFKLIINKRYFNRRQFISVIGFILLGLCGPGIQMLLPGNKIVDFFALSIASFVILVGLETPDFLKLEKALEELEQSQIDLEEAVDRAKAADKAKSDFLANMSHEIRTPINAVLGMNELISRESSETHIQNYSANVADAGNSLLALINDILDFSKIEAGKMELAPANYVLSSLLREVYNMISVRCFDKGLSFTIDNNPNIPNNLYGDEVRIRQILINLLNNAVKYTDKGTINLKIDFTEGYDNSVTLVFYITDTGTGIKEEDLPLLFESFKRIDLDKNRKREGTGLGLSITKSFVDLMCGTIEVQSEYGKGSTFIVRLPQTVVSPEKIGIFSKAMPSEKKEKYKAALLAPAAHILVVDDVEMNLKVMKGLLRPTAIKVDLSLSGAECLKAISENEYDVIFLDHMMPEMDGIETLQKMKADLTHPNQNTPVIMLTANAILGAKEEYLESGFTDYLSKPVRSNELENMLIKYLPEEKLMKRN